MTWRTFTPMPAKSKIWIGIDPGIARLGFGVIARTSDGGLKTIDYGCLTSRGAQPIDQRLLSLYRQLLRVLKKHSPDYMAVEQIYFAKNTKTALTIGHARGIILLVAALHNITVREFTPLQIKQALTGYGRADKHQVQQMVKTILNLKKIPQPDDTADALATALCGIQTKI